MSIESPAADPLAALPRAERPAYATGMLLDAQDFSDEQAYHRGRLARALVFLAGGGTLAGLRVAPEAGTASRPEEISVAPGLAVDRLGRLVDIPRPACLRLQRWFDALAGTDGGDTLRQAAYDNLARFASPRLRDSGVALPARAVVADVYVRFAACKVGLTPSFAAGPFDALNAVSTSRIRDAYELTMRARIGLDDDYSGLPEPLGSPAVGNGGGNAELQRARRDAAQDALLDGYVRATRTTAQGLLEPQAEHPLGLDTSAVFLARVFIPVGVADPPTRTAEGPIADNWGRRFLPPAALLAQANGF